MENNGSDVTSKIRTAITEKLIELGVYVDDELPDYIMVMVANKKNRFQMTDDLSLFLGSNTDGFTKWLHGVLNSLQSNSNEVLKAKPEQAKICSSRDKKDGFGAENVNEEAEDLLSFRNETEIDDSLIKELQRDDEARAAANLASCQEDKVVSTQHQINIVPLTKIVKTKTRITAPDVVVTKTSMKVRPMLQRKGPLSSVSSIINRPENQPNTEEDEYDPCKPAFGSVASVVRIKERRPSVPKELQANKLLIMKAISEANKSLKINKARVEPYKPSPIVYECNPIIKTERIEEVEEIQIESDYGTKDHVSDLDENTENSAVMVEERGPQEPLFEIEYQPEVATGVNKQINPYLSLETSIPTQQGMKRKHDDEEDVHITLPLKDAASPATSFVVTLDGIDFSQLISRKKIQRKVLSSSAVEEGQLNDFENTTMEEDDSFLMEEDYPLETSESFEHEEDIMGDEYQAEYYQMFPPTQYSEVSLTTQISKKKKIQVRCQFWPTCKNGEECIYRHPRRLCKKYPNCNYGAKCKDIHPVCKFDGFCSKLDCPFTHMIKPHNSQQTLVYPKPVANQPLTCKFFPDCFNKHCKFWHPKNCRFGSSCTVSLCTFMHPKEFPPSSKMKWVAPSLLSIKEAPKIAREFAVPLSKVTPMSVNIDSRAAHYFSAS